jgi:hypothetical protein
MVAVRRLLAVLAVAALFAQPLYADVIPTRRAGDASESSKKVESRLVELGVSANDAKGQVQKLTAQETKYFADSPERIQLVGQENFGGQSDNLWWEWLFGIVALVGGALVIYFVLANNGF